jgi:O-antigen/teichoic acid export membrane protein
MSTAGTIAKNSVYNIIANGTELISAFFTSIVLARSLGGEQYGLYAYLVWFLSLMILVVNLGLDEMTKRFIAEAQGQKKNLEVKGIIQLTFIFRASAILLVSAVVIISSKFWAGFTGDPGNQIYFILLALSLIPNQMNAAILSIFKGFQQYKYPTYVHLLLTLLRLISVVVLMSLGYGIKEVLFFNVIIAVLGISYSIILLRHVIPVKELFPLYLMEKVARNRAFRYALTMMGILVVNFLAFKQAEIFIIELYLPMDQVGFYRIAYQLATVAMTIIPIAFGLVLMPAVAEQFGRGDVKKIKEIFVTATRYMYLFSLPMATGMFVLASPIVTALYGPEYLPVIILLQILVFPTAILAGDSVNGAVIQGTNRPGFILIVNIFMAIIGLGLSALFIHAHGILAVVTAKSIVFFLSPVFTTVFVCLKFNIKWPVRDISKAALASAIMGLAVFAVQSQLGPILSLVICIPLGVVLYTVAVFVFRIIRKQDVEMLKRAQESLPISWGKRLTFIIRLVDRFAAKSS